MGEMHDRADPIRSLNFIQALLNDATKKNVTGEQRLIDPHDAAPGRPFDPQAGVKYFDIQIPAQIRRSDVLMLRLGPGTVPGHGFILNCGIQKHENAFSMLIKDFRRQSQT
jgi:hypothetical protein